MVREDVFAGRVDDADELDDDAAGRRPVTVDIRHTDVGDHWADDQHHDGEVDDLRPGRGRKG